MAEYYYLWLLLQHREEYHLYITVYKQYNYHSSVTCRSLGIAIRDRYTCKLCDDHNVNTDFIILRVN